MLGADDSASQLNVYGRLFARRLCQRIQNAECFHRLVRRGVRVALFADGPAEFLDHAGNLIPAADVEVLEALLAVLNEKPAARVRQPHVLNGNNAVRTGNLEPLPQGKSKAAVE